jgi:hypothetical protein
MARNKFKAGDVVVLRITGDKYKVIGTNGKSKFGSESWETAYECCRLRKDGVRPDRRMMSIRSSRDVIGMFCKYRFAENELARI